MVALPVAVPGRQRAQRAAELPVAGLSSVSGGKEATMERLNAALRPNFLEELKYSANLHARILMGA
jgi:hypothetical protein